MKMVATFVKIVFEMCVDIVVDFGHCFGVQLVFGFTNL
jgi:hypothetical protein